MHCVKRKHRQVGWIPSKKARLGDKKTGQKNTSPASHPENGRQPADTNSARTDPASEQRRLRQVSKKRQDAAARMLLMKDLSPMLVVVKESPPLQGCDKETPLDLSADKSKKSDHENPSAISQGQTENTDEQQADSEKTVENVPDLQPVPQLDENTDEQQANSDKTAEHVPDLPPVPQLDENTGRELEIGSVIEINFNDLNTKQLRKNINKLRKDMDKTGKRFYNAYKECLRIRDEYYEKARMHQKIANDIHIRETLKITGKIKQPLTDVQKTLIKSTKLRSGKVLKSEEPDPHLDKQEQFKDTAFQLM